MPPTASPTTADDESTAYPLRDLTTFQLDTLAAIALAEDHPDGDGPIGLAVKDVLEAARHEEIQHGRLYPNLDRLRDMGLIRKGSIDRRTNQYQLTDAGVDQLEAAYDRVAAALVAEGR